MSKNSELEKQLLEFYDMFDSTEDLVEFLTQNMYEIKGKSRKKLAKELLDTVKHIEETKGRKH